MTRLLRVISGSDQSPTIDYTDDVEWTDVQLAMMAADGQSGVGRIPIFDDGGLIPDGQLNRYLNSHNVVTVDDGPYRLFRGRIEKRETGRGKRRGKRVRKISVTTSDYNADLRGIVVNNFVRASESNIVRFQAVATTYLSGSPRATTNLAQTYISSSNALNLAAKTYTGMYVGDVLSDIAKEAGKTFFVTVDGQLFYDGSESTAYASSLRISDDPGDSNATTYAPIWDGEISAAVEDGTEFATNLRTYYGSESSVTSSNTLAVYNDYWELLNWDSLADIASNAQIRSDARLQELAQDVQTITCTIGPIPWAQLGSIKCGQTIQIKALGAVGGRNPGGTFYGDSFRTLRIAELTWKFPAPELNFAVLRLIRPPKISGAGTGNQALVVAKQVEQDATFTLGSSPTIQYAEAFESETGGFTAWAAAIPNYQGRVGVDLIGASTDAVCSASPPKYLWFNQQIMFAGIRTDPGGAGMPANSNYVGAQIDFTSNWNDHSKGNHGGISGIDSLQFGPVGSMAFAGSTFQTSDVDGVGGTGAGAWSGTLPSRSVTIFVPSNYVNWGGQFRVVFVPNFRLANTVVCEQQYGLTLYGSGSIGDATIKPKSIASPGWLTAGIIGAQNGSNTAFTLVGGWGDIESVTVNGLDLPLSQVDLSGGTPNIVFRDFAPKITDLILVRYRSL